MAFSLAAYIARRIALNREKTFSRFIIRIAIVATTLSVAVMILATALVNGFQQAVSQKIFSFWGHLHVEVYQPDYAPLSAPPPFPENDSLLRIIRHLPQVATVQPYATQAVIIKSTDDLDGVIFKGVKRDYDWRQLQSYLVAGHLPTFPDSGYADEILISADMAQRLNLRTGDKVVVYFVPGSGQTPRPRVLKISGIYRTGVQEYDHTYIIGDLRLIALMNGWQPDEIGGFEIFLRHVNDMDTVNQLLDKQILPQNLMSVTIRQIYPNIFDWLRLQTTNEWIILVIMVIVAVINMTTAILILILERTHMVAILKAMGMQNRQIQMIFVWHATLIFCTGILFGNMAGLGLAWLQYETHFFKLPEDIYYIAYAPIAIRFWQVIAIDAGTLLVGVGLLRIPALIIRRIYPVQALRFQ
ncbi:lipoprotein-releasing system permease protein [Thermoflavifilum aggregans]|uniref:Lipoprotein-releasing system permease protein n=1 Tax=Thermoflavifilum aggregans TaxID=454188 RepID=A0A2M9CUH1_9BACT|nr:FtsX-like permease family protein [Thermoflavifilum aggregans]PJJ75495.1 lipoprotein-releasing system permease protein [Thermoflavifilum aggregans]